MTTFASALSSHWILPTIATRWGFNGLILFSRRIAGIVPLAFPNLSMFFIFRPLSKGIPYILSPFLVTPCRWPLEKRAFPLNPSTDVHNFDIHDLARTFFIIGSAFSTLFPCRDLPIIFPKAKGIIKMDNFLLIWKTLFFVQSHLINMRYMMFLPRHNFGSQRDLLSLLSSISEGF